MNNLDFIYKRHSVRRFKDLSVPMIDIKEIIKAAIYAPSGKNAQNWHFVVIRNQNKIEELAKVIEMKNSQLADHMQNEEQKMKFKKFLKFSTVFRTAPVVILIYASKYEPTGLKELKEAGASNEEIEDLIQTSPGIQGVSAAIENMLLAAANMGYGTVWMTSANYAAKEITEFIGFNKEGYSLTAITPLGIPDGEIKNSPPRKPIEEVMDIIE